MSILVFALLSILTATYSDSIKVPKQVQSVEYSISNNQLTYSFKNQETNKEIKFVPQTDIYAGLAVSFKKFTLSSKFRDPFKTEEEDQGIEKSNYFDIGLFGFLTPTWTIEAFYQKYNGYKLENSNDSDLANIEAKNIGIHVRHFFSKDFNPQEIYRHSYLKKVTGYSQFVASTIAQQSITSNSYILPASYQSEFPNYQDLKRVKRQSIALAYGILGQYVYSHYFAQGGISLGLNMGETDYNSNILKNSFKAGSYTNVSIGLGYQFKHSLLGLGGHLYSQTDGQDAQQLSITREEFNLYYHYFF